MVNAAGEDTLDHFGWLVIYEVVKDLKREMAAEGRADEFWGAKVRAQGCAF